MTNIRPMMTTWVSDEDHQADDDNMGKRPSQPTSRPTMVALTDVNSKHTMTIGPMG